MASIGSGRRVDMDNTWRNIFRDFIACYAAIETLEKNGVIKDDEVESHKYQLLDNIIEAMKNEVEE